MTREWNHNIEYHRVVLDNVPRPCASALDVGCGEGLLTRQLAGCCGHVTALDLDPQVLATAATAQPQLSNVTYMVEDIMIASLPPSRFTFLCSIATLHHLPLEPALMRFSELLAPGGVLVIIGLYRAQGIADAVFAAAGMIASQVKRRFFHLRSMNAPMQEPQQTLDEIGKAAERLLPGSRLRRRLFFRYSLAWHKPI